MKTKLSLFLPVLFCFLLMPFASNTASAFTARVYSNSSLCTSVTPTNPCYTSVQTAIQDATMASSNIDTIEIHPGNYAVANATLTKGVTILGVETAATILNGNGAGTILSIDTVNTSMSIKNLTFFSANRGILVRNSSSVIITNNIFEIGASSTAIQVAASSPKIANNTFFVNGVGITSDVLTLNIINNIFYQSGGTAITPPGMDLTSIKNNLFFGGGTIGPPVLTATTMPISADPINSDVNFRGNISNLDPLFVNTTPSDITQRDFHLISTPTNTSPCRDTGNPSEGADSVDGTQATDIGAYGGSNSDTIPFLVSGLNSSATSTAPAIVTLSWTANKAYTVKGYNIYYGYASGVYDGNDAIVSGETATTASPIDAGNTTTKSLIVSRTSVTPAATVLNEPSPLNNSLKLTWSAVSGATGYNIYYSLASAPTITFPAIPVSGGNTTAYTLSGLTNGVFYNILVTAVSQAAYYFSITAYDTTSTTGTPGVAHESDHSAEKVVTVGDIKEGGPSNMVIGMPEPTIPNPNLPNTGCFIATAAYGSPSSSAVQVLREFRDRYLVTNAPGRAFVSWYYEHSPAVAAVLNEHPAWKPAVRAVLAPAVAVALFLNHTSPAMQMVVMVMLIVVTAILFRRIRTMRSRMLTKGTTD
jgi:hypothetical protein